MSFAVAGDVVDRRGGSETQVVRERRAGADVVAGAWRYPKGYQRRWPSKYSTRPRDLEIGRPPCTSSGVRPPHAECGRSRL